MDEQEYKDTYRALNEIACPFEKSILSRQCGCEYAQRFHLADREGVGCCSAPAQVHCVALLALLHRNAQFALKTTQVLEGLPHAKEMKVQVGGLLGLQGILFPQEEGRQVQNIFRLIQAARETYVDLESLPYQRVVKAIAGYQGRRRPSSRDGN
jgi:hypothetical protein